MAECLQTKKSNCKNCYKCIRHCPVKSIGFADGQAHIMQDECVLCGECYVICPQNAKQIRNDISLAKQLIMSNDEVYVSLAPSFAACYANKSIKDVEKALKKLGFKGVSEEDFNVNGLSEKELQIDFSFEGISKVLPSGSAIEEALKEMGKTINVSYF